MQREADITMQRDADNSSPDAAYSAGFVAGERALKEHTGYRLTAAFNDWRRRSNVSHLSRDAFQRGYCDGYMPSVKPPEPVEPPTVDAPSFMRSIRKDEL
jgi:hypothetical protein